MEKPVIAARGPAIIECEPGVYYWCRCGRSQGQPFCDGSHGTTSFQPLRIEVTKRQKIAFCQCKQTGKEPRCDGSHNRLPKE